MVAIEQALEALLAVIIFIGVVFLFFSMFGSTECDKLSNTTAIELTNAISKVALGDGVSPWNSDSVPSDDKTGQYEIVPIRLCEKNRMSAFSAMFSAQTPSYILTYQTFPEASFSWSESQPWSGGAGQSLMNFAVMKYGMKFGTYVGKYAVKIGRGGVSLSKIGINLGASAVLGRIGYIIDNSRVVKFLRSVYKRIRSTVGKPVEEELDARLNVKYYGGRFSKWKSLVGDLKNDIMSNKLSEEEALVKAGIIEGGKDASGRYTAAMLYDQYQVKDNYGQFMNLWIDNSGEAAGAAKAMYHIPPSRLGSALAKFKTTHWYPFKTAVKAWWNRRWISNGVNKIVNGATNAYGKVKSFVENVQDWIRNTKNGFNRWFNHEDSTLLSDVPRDIGQKKSYMLAHLDQTRDEIDKSFDEFKPYLEKVIKDKAFNSIDDLTDEELIQFISKGERYYITKGTVLVLSREQQELSGLLAKGMGETFEERANLIREAAQAGRIGDANKMLREVQLIGEEFDATSVEQQALLNRYVKGYTGTLDNARSKEAWEYLRTSAYKNGVLDAVTAQSDVSQWTPIMMNKFVDSSSKIRNEMTDASIRFSKQNVPQYAVSDFMLAPVLTDTSDSALRSILSYGWKRTKRGVWLDFNRIGQGIAPYNLIPGAYAAKTSLQIASEIKEGGCAQNAICRIVRGGVEGPTESASAFTLDRDVPAGLKVQLWRPNPGALDRIPAGINTILLKLLGPKENPNFYVVSPCFGMAKVWKNNNTNTVYVTIEKEKKCNVNCSQPNVTLNMTIPSLNIIPFTGISSPELNFGEQTIGLSSDDTPNYCYADEQFIWGNNDDPNMLAYFTTYGICAGVCWAATQGSGIKACLKACEYPVIGALGVNALAATQDYANVPSWKRQETGWGYWNYQKAGDICDAIDFIASFGSFGARKPPGEQILPGYPTLTAAGGKLNQFKSAGRVEKVLTTSGQGIQKLSKYSTISMTDICFAFSLIGDTALSWPIKAPISLNPLQIAATKAATLDDKCMQTSAADCAWLKHCDPDDTTDKCGEGMFCDSATNTCKVNPTIIGP
ncbi:MAG: hypothetical protein V1678_03065 [Candidatus Aenigmatarchaeota archaeon]